MKLYLVHCGYYDSKICDGLFESHTNIFIVAEDVERTRVKVKKSEIFQEFRMHIDGIQEIDAVDGFEIKLNENSALRGNSIVLTHKHRDLAPKNTPNL